MREWIRRRRADREATCAEVAAVLQSYLDGCTDELTARRIRRHLDRCRRCGLEAETYEAIKDSLARHGPQVPAESLSRLKSFSESLFEDRSDPAS
ncbi:MAG: zf-HC2 domain-containing protein [Actinomycetota bacterium]|nr:zf-HC2 domain-containing protein [Actinomycetota bacterium]